MTIVDVEGGRLEGRTRAASLLFAGIPFAAPPVGARRWQSPVAHPGWRGVRDATRFGPIACQPDEDHGRHQSEDCLLLNVQTPSLTGTRPVVVWIHGGAFTRGSSSHRLYDTTRLVCDHDVVAVTLNYRLGVLGWLHLAGHIDGFPGSGTNGLQDQLRALTWVRDNIATFGGDPSNVTVWGHSAGAVSAASLLGSPAADGLLHRVICQSGAADHAKAPDLASEVTDRLLHHLGTRSVDDLLAMPTGQLLEAQSAIDVAVGARQWLDRPGPDRMMAFGPIVGEPVLPHHPRAAIASGRTPRVPLIVGTTRDEMAGRFDSQVGAPDLDSLAERLGTTAADLLAAYETDDARTAYQALRVDIDFRVPAIRLAEANSPGAPTFLYEFAWHRPDLPTGAEHGLELPFVFDTLHKAGVGITLVGPEPPRSLADAMQGAWTTFARTGRPELPDGTRWSTYDEGRRTMILDDPCTVVGDPGATRRLEVQSVLDRRDRDDGQSG
jgi:para-nitrobenzyl esterase